LQCSLKISFGKKSGYIWIMKLCFGLSVVCIIMCATFKVQAQDWDDFDPPPPTEYGGPQPGGAEPPPPPPPPNSGFESAPPLWDNPTGGRSSSPNFSNGAGPQSGAVVFKKTGKKRDLTKKNPRLEELLKENP
jgi:hypothetical protein